MYSAIVLISISCGADDHKVYGQQEQKPREHKPPTFAKLLEKMDANKDGKLAKTETKGPLQKDFATIDPEWGRFHH